MRILIVENSKTVTSMIAKTLAQVSTYSIDTANTLSQAEKLIEENGPHSYKIAITGLNLPDAQNQQIVKTITEYQIPTIIFSASIEEVLHDEILKIRGVIDYVVKESQATLQYLSHMVYRLEKNKAIKVIVAEDSKAIRMLICELLRQYEFEVLEAANGQDALQLLEQHRDVKLVVTDYNMTPIDGFELTKKIRETYGKDELAIIGVSGTDSARLSSRFIKFGANDFLTKPFEPEEFFCRITQNIDLIERAKALSDAANKDFLTGLYNRRYFFEKGIGKLTRARKEKAPVALAMLDIDHFKSVNDTYGHDVGDEVLKVVANLILSKSRPDDLVARMGGEEFCILLQGLNKNDLEQHFETIRHSIEETILPSLQERKNVTSSFGVILTSEDENDLDAIIKQADELLYNAKQTGRNKVTLGN